MLCLVFLQVIYSALKVDPVCLVCNKFSLMNVSSIYIFRPDVHERRHGEWSSGDPVCPLPARLTGAGRQPAGLSRSRQSATHV